MTTTTSFALESSDTVSSVDLREIAATEGGYEAYRVWSIGEDGHRDSVAGDMIWHPTAGRAGIAFGGDSVWTDANSPEDAAERFFGIDGKEMAI